MRTVHLMKLTIALLVLAIPAQCLDPSALACGAIGADVLTTRWALGRGAVEGNPVYRAGDGRISWAKVIGIGAGSCAGMLVAGRLVRGRPKWKRVLSTVVLAGAGVRGFAVGWNIQVGRRNR